MGPPRLADGLPRLAHRALTADPVARLEPLLVNIAREQRRRTNAVIVIGTILAVLLTLAIINRPGLF